MIPRSRGWDSDLREIEHDEIPCKILFNDY